MPSLRSSKGKPARWNMFSLGRGAFMAGKGVSQARIAEHYFQRYGPRWNIQSVEEMRAYLFDKGRGLRPRFNQYEGLSRTTIRSRIRSFLEQREKMSAGASTFMSRLHQDEAFARNRNKQALKNSRSSRTRAKISQSVKDWWAKGVWATRKKYEGRSERTKAQWRNPALRKKLMVGIRTRWNTIRANIRSELGIATSGIGSRDPIHDRRVTYFDRENGGWEYHEQDTTSADVIKREEQERVVDSLMPLSPREREVVMGLFIEGRSVMEMIESLRISRKRLITIRSQALKKMREQIQRSSA